MNFFKKIEGIDCGVVIKSFLAEDSSHLPGKYSKQTAQLLLDKAGELIYLHKIFQHISVLVSGER